MLVYWVSILIVDFIKFSFLIVLLYPFLIYRYYYLITSLAIVVFFIISACLVNYILSHLFETETNGQKFSLLIIYLAFTILIVLDVIKNMDYLGPESKKEHIYRFYFSDLFPSSELGLSLWMLIR